MVEVGITDVLIAKDIGTTAKFERATALARGGLWRLLVTGTGFVSVANDPARDGRAGGRRRPI